ncbi:MAG TPA: hypothetical protein VHL58_15280 [Thermoanaerobaculia bacterium]|nr:hypothetical protein [Thermoanaerobaculia bacterium]
MTSALLVLAAIILLWLALRVFRLFLRLVVLLVAVVLVVTAVYYFRLR